MDISLRLLMVFLLLVAIGCDSSEGPAAEERPAAETAQPVVPGPVEEEESVQPAADADETATDEDMVSEPEVIKPAETTPPETTDTAKPPVSPAPRGPSDEQWQQWAAALTDRQDDAARRAAAEKLDELAAGGNVDFVEVLSAGSPEARRCAAFFLVDRVDPSDPAIAGPFIAALSDKDGPVRHIALSVVKRFPKETLVSAAPQLAEMMADQNEQAANRAAIARLLGGLEAEARPVQGELMRSMAEDPDQSVRSACLMAVSRVAEPPDAATVISQALARDTEAGVRGLAAVRLGRLGHQTDAATTALADALEDSDESVRQKARDALIAIGAPSVPPLTRKLQATDAATRRLAVFALGRLGPAASSAAAELKKRLQDEDEEVRKLAELAIGRIEGGQ